MLHQQIHRSLAAAVLAAALAVSASAVAVAADAPDAVSWTVRTVDNANGSGRPNFSYQVDPGASLDDAMLVANTGTAPLDLSVYAADAFTTSTGDIDILPTAADSVDAGTWIRPGLGTVHLEPGQSAEIPFHIAVPADARPGDHSAGLVTALAQAGSGTLAVERRLGSRLHLRVSGALAPDAAVENLHAAFVGTWNPFGSGTLVLDYRLANTGNTRVTATESVAVAGPFGVAPSGEGPTQLPEVLPGSTIEVHRELSVPVLGWLTGSVVISPEGVGLGAGSIAPVHEDIATDAVPWTFLAIVVVIAAGVVVLLLVRRRRRSRADA